MKHIDSPAIYPLPSLGGGLAAVFIIATGALLYKLRPDLYHQMTQEDGPVEWATFWSFLMSAFLFFAAAWPSEKPIWRGWFLWGVGLFCLFVGLEEISWGQRLMGYQPPTYFLQNNYQQELNLHNIAGKSFRVFALQAIMLGYGFILPLVSGISMGRKFLERLHIKTHSLSLAPPFLAASLLYKTYPWQYAGEWVEVLLGFCFLFSALELLFLARENFPPLWRKFLIIGGPLVIVLSGFASTTFLQSSRANDVEKENFAKQELKQLQSDFETHGLQTSCGLHKRIFTYAQKYKAVELRNGEFGRNLKKTGEDGRSEFFLDPWNTPYWVLHQCSKKQVSRFLYSFGPNRQRDSTDREVLGDDIGVYMGEGK